MIELLAVACLAFGVAEVMTALCMMPKRLPLEPIDIASIKIRKEDSECCPICFEENKNKDLRVTACGHIFCAACFEAWYKKTPRCPLCNFEFVKTT